MKRVFMVVCFFLLVSMGYSQVEGWVRVESQSYSYSCSLPAEPKREKKELNGVHVEKLQYSDVANVFGVVVSDFSGVGVNFANYDNSEYYQAMKQASLVTGDAILVSEQSVAYKNMLGKEIVYTLMVKGKEYTYYKRFFFRNHLVYQLVIGGPSRLKKLLLDKKDLFFNSLNFE